MAADLSQVRAESVGGVDLVGNRRVRLLVFVFIQIEGFDDLVFVEDVIVIGSQRHARSGIYGWDVRGS